MSHVAKIEIEIRDLEALDRAAKELGLELIRGQKTYRWYGRSVGDYPLPTGFTAADLGKCDHAIRIPNSSSAYEIGVVARRDGRPGYTLLWDFWNGGYGLVDKVGTDGKKLTQSYTKHMTIRHWQAKGYRVQTFNKPDGRIEVKVSR